MSFFRQTERKYAYVLWFLLIFLSISCRSSTQPEAGIAEITPLPTSTLPVEYGASLDEWEEATEAKADQTESGDDTTTEGLQPQAVDVATTVATSPTEADEAADVAEVTDVASTEAVSEIEAPVLYSWNNTVYQEIKWNGLIPANFTSAAITAKYEDQLAQFEDGSPEASELYRKMQEEFNNAPVNETLNETYIRLPGFIAPLEYTDDLITKFLLVPYFGACIHVPPPPVNQTVLVEADAGYGIKSESSYNPIWVMGKLTVEASTTELAVAGYYIQDAIIAPYNY